MKRFLTLTLGVALLAAAPLSAQSAPSDKAAALLQQAQEAAAHGRSAKAAELARAAAELLMAQQDQRATHDPFRARVIREQDPSPSGPMMSLEDLFVHRTGPAGPVGSASPHAAHAQEPAGPGGPMMLRSRAPQPSHAQEDELSLTMKLIHAEVQALRAEVQAMRAEMALARLQGGAGHAAAPMGEWTEAAPHVEWHEAAPEARRHVIIIGHDGEMIEHGDLDLEWTGGFGDDEDGFEIEIEDSNLEALRALGYVVSPDGLPQRDVRVRLRAIDPFATGGVRVTPATPATPATPPTPTVRERPNRPNRQDRPQR